MEDAADFECVVDVDKEQAVVGDAEAEFALLEERARAAGLTLSEWLFPKNPLWR